MALTALEVKSFSCPGGKKITILNFGSFVVSMLLNIKKWVLGEYPTISLHEARNMAEEARK